MAFFIDLLSLNSSNNSGGKPRYTGYMESIISTEIGKLCELFSLCCVHLPIKKLNNENKQ
jgi:hypothetical protein